MELHFIWINNSEPLCNVGINLSAKYIIELEKTENSNFNFILNFSINEEYIPNFFDSLSITNVTAVIGKNGSGKSSILKYIKNNLSEGQIARVFNDIFIYSLHNDIKEEFFIVVPQNIEIDLVSNNHTDIKINEIKFENGGDLRFKSEIANPHIIYYSYLIDYNEDFRKMKGITNISTSFLMMEERNRIIDEIGLRHGAEIGELLIKTNDLDNLHISEVTNAVEFLSSDFGNLPFDKPLYLDIEIDLSDRMYFALPPNNHSELDNTLKLIEERIKTSNNNLEKMRDNFIYSILLNFLITDYKYTSNAFYNHPLKEMGNETIKEYVLNYFLSMGNLTFEYEGNAAFSTRHDSYSKSVTELISLFDMLVSNKIIEFGGITIMKFSINSTSNSFFKSFIEQYRKVRGLSRFLKFRWRSLSGGEQSYLSFMSRFYNVKVNSVNQLPKELMILVDEGDIGYHPEWQRTFFDNTLKFFNLLFVGHRIQLIITSNTPFLSSDLPKNHVLFLELGQEKTRIIHSKNNNRDSTFAANIHTLFSDSMYMDGILIGQFAKNKLDQIIKYLKNEKDLNEISDINYKKTIDIIGEPIIRLKLLEMWSNKFDKDDEIAILERRIKELKDKKNGNKI